MKECRRHQLIREPTVVAFGGLGKRALLATTKRPSQRYQAVHYINRVWRWVTTPPVSDRMRPMTDAEFTEWTAAR
jgi:hypothetical protein